MHKTVILAILSLLVAACDEIDMPTKTVEIPRKSEKTAATPTPGTTPSPSPTLQLTPKPEPDIQGITDIGKTPPSITKLVTDIHSGIGCNKVDDDYKIKVVTIAIALDKPQSLEGLNSEQIKEAVKQSSLKYPEKASNLVAQYRARYCTKELTPQTENPILNPEIPTTTPLPNSKIDSNSLTPSSVIPEQTGNCKQLAEKGIKDINTVLNPWASKLDRNKDGIACESKDQL